MEKLLTETKLLKIGLDNYGWLILLGNLKMVYLKLKTFGKIERYKVTKTLNRKTLSSTRIKLYSKNYSYYK